MFNFLYKWKPCTKSSFLCTETSFLCEGVGCSHASSLLVKTSFYCSKNCSFSIAKVFFYFITVAVYHCIAIILHFSELYFWYILRIVIVIFEFLVVIKILSSDLWALRRTRCTLKIIIVSWIIIFFYHLIWVIDWPLTWHILFVLFSCSFLMKTLWQY